MIQMVAIWDCLRIGYPESSGRIEFPVERGQHQIGRIEFPELKEAYIRLKEEQELEKSVLFKLYCYLIIACIAIGCHRCRSDHRCRPDPGARAWAIIVLFLCFIWETRMKSESRNDYCRNCQTQLGWQDLTAPFRIFLGFIQVGNASSQKASSD